MAERAVLAGWGRAPSSAADLVRPTSAAALAATMGNNGERGLIARGLGRSYGDAAQSAGGTVVVTTGAGAIDELDTETGLLRAEAGASIEAIHTLSVPTGWFLPVVPGTRFVTLGGAIAADIHGKNHHGAGSFGNHVRSIRLALGTGEVVDVGPDRDGPLFWATLGGMGMTGIVVSAEVQLTPITSSELAVESTPTSDLDATMTALLSADATHPYTVAWVDATARAARLGRGIVEAGRFCDHGGELAYAPRRPVAAPPLPSGLVGSSGRLLNRAWYRLGAVGTGSGRRSIGSFFHPLDGVGGWNRMYGTGGLVQWQMVVPLGAEALVAGCLGAFASTGAPAVLAVLKRFGPTGSGHLSFPLEGWTLAVDLAASDPAVAALLDDLDKRVVDAGGRIYLAKDSRVDPELIPDMYPRLAEWQEIRHRADPDGRLRSDLSRRLGL